MTELIRTGFVTEAYANWSRWVAHCGRHPCPRAVSFPRAFVPWFECDFCGAVTEVLWPSVDMVTSIERLLMMRPVPSTRSWLPGETMRDLMRENYEHGVLQMHTDPEVKPGPLLVVVDDGKIRTDSLPVLKHRVRKAIT